MSEGQRTWLPLSGIFGDNVAPVRDKPERAESDANSALGSDTQAEMQELSALRFEICDIQEAIRNHDAWVQDAAYMRTDIDEIRSWITEQNKWMLGVNSALEQLQKKDQLAATQIEDLRRTVQQPQAKEDSGARSRSRSCEDDQGLEQEIQRIEVGLANQVSCGLRMLRTMMTDIEAGLVRQLEIERQARKAMVAEVRSELAGEKDRSEEKNKN